MYLLFVENPHQHLLIREKEILYALMKEHTNPNSKHVVPPLIQNLPKSKCKHNFSLRASLMCFARNSVFITEVIDHRWRSSWNYRPIAEDSTLSR